MLGNDINISFVTAMVMISCCKQSQTVNSQLYQQVGSHSFAPKQLRIFLNVA